MTERASGEREIGCAKLLERFRCGAFAEVMEGKQIVDRWGRKAWCDKLKARGAVAQLGARLDGIEEVVGSNPIGSTN